jgi:glycosyltransferase involved in cell wall biosynthesis
MSKVRILQLIPSLPVGGAERMLLQLVSNLDPSRYEITVASLHRLGTTMERDFAAAGFDVLFLEKRLGFDPRMFGRVAGVIRRVDPHLLHTHRPVLQYALPSLLGKLRQRTVHTVHNVAEREVTGRAAQVGHWLAIRAGVAPIAICQSVADSIWRVYGVRARAIIPNGIPVAQFATPSIPRQAWRTRQGIPHDALVFTCVARLSAQKNVGALLQALAAMDRRRDPVLLVCGDGEEQGRLEAEAGRLGVAERVRFLGSRADVPEVLGASDVFVLPSLYEGHPLSVMEAMAAGRPVIATTVGGVPELVQPGETGLLVPPGDTSALAAAMDQLARSEEERGRLGRRGAQVAAERFDVSHMAAAYDRLYQSMLSRGPLA